MKHVPPPGRPDEPPWIKTLREIDAHITKEVMRYIKLRRSMLFWSMWGGMAGYWIGFGSVELLKWWVGIR